MKKIYVCSPLRGNYEYNIRKAKEYCRSVALLGCIPFAPHIYLTQFLDDNVKEERELGLQAGKELIYMCDELWVFGINAPSSGMQGEIAAAKEAGIPVKNGFEAIGHLHCTGDDMEGWFD